MQLTPVITVHMSLAIGALALGPVALGLRKGSPGHRGVGYAWVALMVGAALSSLFIRDHRLPNLAGYTPIHLFPVISLVGIGYGIAQVVRHNIAAHRATMLRVYLGGCVGAGLFALLPSRYLGGLLWHNALGLV